jgi:hypothetical protein
MIISKCWIERGFGGYLIDIFTAGGFTTYRTLEYTKCMQNVLNKKISTTNIDDAK